MPPLRIWTIGHSTRSAEEFLALLQENRIELLVDVRRFPGSRRYPHFNEPELSAVLAPRGIGYALMVDLGGRRRARPDSHNTVWRNASFRGYADYMETAEFQQATERLQHLARKRSTAIMCSEAVWWQCHRSLIADYLKARGGEVTHILAPGKTALHPYTRAASLIDGELSYRAGEEGRN
jgi:uncharacterized protein (DUF488 family)